MNFSEKLQEYYSSGYEKTRLASDQAHSIEFLTTVHYFDEFLPEKSRVLDCCAGGGIYSYYLAEKGFQVTTADLSHDNVEIIKANKNSELLNGIHNLNVLDMAVFDDESFDVVLCMGAFYHLKSAEERLNCVAECLRVLKKSGIFVLAYINRNPCVLYQFFQQPKNIAKQAELIQTGDNNLFYAVDFDEIEQVVQKFNLTKIKNIGVDGSAYPLQKKINSLNRKRFNEFMRYHFSVCEEPSVIGNSMHGLLIAGKD